MGMGRRWQQRGGPAPCGRVRMVPPSHRRPPSRCRADLKRQRAGFAFASNRIMLLA